jgi:hypothetical protein
MHRMFLLAALSLASALVSTAALADDPATGGTATATAANSDVAPPVSAAPDPDSVVLCKVFPPPTGTLIGARRICKTHHDWNLEQARGRDLTNDIQTRGLTSMPASAGGH